MVLFIKHIAIEGPGLLGDYFMGRGYDVRIADVSAGDPLPVSLRNIQAVVVLGGPMNVYETKKYPFLWEEDAFIKRTISAKIPILGICLGGQLMAKALGAKVRKNPSEEIGFYKTKLEPDGEADMIFSGLRGIFTVFQWHGDTFDVPDGARRLASSKLCANQAFSFKDFAYGIQFHVEVDGGMISEWCSEYRRPSDNLIVLSSPRKRGSKFRRGADARFRGHDTIVDLSDSPYQSAGNKKHIVRAKRMQTDYRKYKTELRENLAIIAGGFEAVIKKMRK